MEKKIKKLKNLLLECKRISIVTHLNPDGDAIGSSLALNHYFKSLNLISNVITPNRHPSFLDWVPGINDIVICDEDTEKSNKIIADSDLIFTMDFNSLDRCGNISNIINKENQKIVMIDHHQLPENYADINFSYPKISSTCEIVYFIIEASNKIQQEINGIDALVGYPEYQDEKIFNSCSCKIFRYNICWYKNVWTIRSSNMDFS